MPHCLPQSQKHPLAPSPLLILVLRCAHCPPIQATTVVCAGCGQPLQGPFDGPFDLTTSAMLDWLTLIHDHLDAHHPQAGDAA